MKFKAIINKLTKIPKQRRLLSIAIVLASSTLTIGICLLIIKVSTKADTSDDSKRYSSPTIITEEAELKIQESSPSAGPLQFEPTPFIYSSDESSQKFIYTTKERRDNRLVELNDQILAELRKIGQIDDQTKSFTIDYFNDATVAKEYFVKVNDQETTIEEKLKLKENYIASMAYSKTTGINHLIRISTAKIIKQFK